MVYEKDLQAYFSDELQWGWDHQAQLIFAFLSQAANVAKGGVVLDVGAGHQRYKPFFEKSTYVSLEHPDAGVANKKLTRYHILADASQIPLKNNSVDLILSTSSLEHIANPRGFFSESARILKPGGSLFINVPFAYWEHETPYDFQRFTRYGLNLLFELNSFIDIDIYPTSSSIYTASQLLIASVHEDGRLLGNSFYAKSLRRILLFLAHLSCRTLLHYLDRSPLVNTTLPIGWIAIGYKQGFSDHQLSYSSARSFIEASFLQSTSYICKNGKIVPYHS